MIEEFLQDKGWKISDFDDNENTILLESKDGSEFLELDVNGIIAVAQKMHLQYDDEDVEMMFK